MTPDLIWLLYFPVGTDGPPSVQTPKHGTHTALLTLSDASAPAVRSPAPMGTTAP